MNKRLLAWCACAPLCLGGGAALAQAGAEAAVPAVPVASSPTSRPGSAPSAAGPFEPLIGLYGMQEHGISRRAAPLLPYAGGARRDESVPLVSVVTLPVEPRPGRPPGRNHHALSLRHEGSTQALRSMGFDVTDCATRVRFPSSFHQSSANAEAAFEASAQVSWLCRF